MDGSKKMVWGRSSKKSSSQLTKTKFLMGQTFLSAPSKGWIIWRSHGDGAGLGDIDDVAVLLILVDFNADFFGVLVKIVFAGLS
jgi:hypothetical protein